MTENVKFFQKFAKLIMLFHKHVSSWLTDFNFGDRQSIKTAKHQVSIDNKTRNITVHPVSLLDYHMLPLKVLTFYYFRVNVIYGPFIQL